MNIFLKIDDYGYVIDTVTEEYFNEQTPFNPYYYVSPYSIEERFIRPKYNRMLGKFVESEMNEGILGEFKQLKNDDLNRIRDKKIADGFLSSNGHYYRMSMDDQVNMMGQKDKLREDETIMEVEWKTEDSGFIKHTREDWLNVYREAFAHKEEQIFKCNQLKQQVLGCVNLEEINAVVWS
jgi:hypothetical protein